MSLINDKCSDCEIIILNSKGLFWNTGAYLCKKCYDKWNEKRNKERKEFEKEMIKIDGGKQPTLVSFYKEFL